MRGWLFGLVTLILMPIMAAAQDARGNTQITIAPSGEDMLVTIGLDRPVERLDFMQADVVRDDSLTVETDGVTFVGNALIADAPRSEFTLRLAEDATERDAKYPPYYRISEGRLLYAPTIYPGDDEWEISLLIGTLPDGWTRWPETPLPMGYLFLGPQDQIVEEHGVRFVFDGLGDEAFEREIRSTGTRAIAFLTELFGSPPQTEPFIATSLMPGERRFSTGDVTDGAMIALRFFGNGFDPAAPGALTSTRSIILHEGVHFWNGGVAHFAEDTPQWVHEGSAEYIANLASYRLGWSEREQMTASMTQWLDRCSTWLSYSDEPALNELRTLDVSLRYSCGPLLFWLADLYLAERGSDLAVTDGWRETVRLAVAENDGEYDLSAMLAAFDAPDLLEEPALAAILATSGPERWSLVDQELRRLGVGLVRESTPHLRARTALMHLIREQCQLREGEGYGFYYGDTTYRLQTPEGCGILAGDPVIETLAGFPVTQLEAERYAELQRLCAAGEAIVFGVVDGEVIEVPCSSPLPDAATQPTVTSLPDIPAFAAPD